MDEHNKKQSGGAVDPQPNHGNDQNGHEDHGNHLGRDRKPATSHATIACVKKL